LATVEGNPPEARKMSMDSFELFRHLRNAAASSGLVDCFMTTCAEPPFSALAAVPS